MKATFVVLLGLLTFDPAFAAGGGRVMRNWTSSDGKTLQAELLEFTDKEVKVKLSTNFNVVKIPLDRLSDGDRKYVLDMEASLTAGVYAPQITGKFEKGASKQGLPYLTGSSMGGFGAWSLAAKHPKVFACAVPLCGGGDPKNAEALKNVPIWAFHGDQDDLVPI